jgi:hypothetical protein
MTRSSAASTSPLDPVVPSHPGHPPMSYEISHLDALESEAIHVFREVAAELE